MEVNEWVDHVGVWAKGKGWDDRERPAAEWVALLHTEVSEAFEAYRAVGNMHDVWEAAGKPEGYTVELVDCLIRIFHNLSVLGVDANALLNMKMHYNEGRPYRHGGKHA